MPFFCDIPWRLTSIFTRGIIMKKLAFVLCGALFFSHSVWASSNICFPESFVESILSSAGIVTDARFMAVVLSRTDLDLFFSSVREGAEHGLYQLLSMASVDNAPLHFSEAACALVWAAYASGAFEEVDVLGLLRSKMSTLGFDYRALTKKWCEGWNRLRGTCSERDCDDESEVGVSGDVS